MAEAHNGWLDHLAATGEHISRSYADVALVQAAIEAYDAQLAVEQTQFYASAVRGRPQVRSEIGRTAELRYRGHHYLPKVYRLGPGEYRVEVNGARITPRLSAWICSSAGSRFSGGAFASSRLSRDRVIRLKLMAYRTGSIAVTGEWCMHRYPRCWFPFW